MGKSQKSKKIAKILGKFSKKIAENSKKIAENSKKIVEIFQKIVEKIVEASENFPKPSPPTYKSARNPKSFSSRIA